MLVTISGLPGSGTSTAARAVAEALGLERLDGGTVFRAMAAERGLSLADFSAVAEADDSFDRQLDARLEERGRQGDVVLESRLAGWLAHNAGLDGLKVWLACDRVERARRVSGRDAVDLDGAVAETEAREASERQRYLDYYEIDLTDLSIYDLVLDSATMSVEATVAAIVDAASKRSTGA